MDLEIRLLTGADAPAFWRLRLEALEREPQAFGASVEEHKAMPMETVVARITPKESGFVVGAFAGGELIGMGGFYREDRPKIWHKGTIWGVYVTAAWRAKGVAKKILSIVLERLRTFKDLDHVVLHVTNNQAAARRVYTSLGFETIGHERRAFKIGDDYIDQDHMVLWLHPEA